MENAKHKRFYEKLKFWISLFVVPLVFLLIIFVVLQIDICYKVLQEKHGDKTWEVLGDIGKNLSGILAFIAAILTVCVLLWTNFTRAREAAIKDFNDQMRWAFDNIGKNDEYKNILAIELIKRYDEYPPFYLPKKEKEVANKLLRKFHELNTDKKPEENYNIFRREINKKIISENEKSEFWNKTKLNFFTFIKKLIPHSNH